MSFLARYDGNCDVCSHAILKGDLIDLVEGIKTAHDRCAADLADGHIVEWRTTESVERLNWEEREIRRISPLGKQGACPVCKIELPASGICDDHGRPA